MSALKAGKHLDLEPFELGLELAHTTHTVKSTVPRTVHDTDIVALTDVVAAAVLDRLLHHSYPFFINGKSYRLKNIENLKS